MEGAIKAWRDAADEHAPQSYVLIGYKPNSADYCMNCHMASYESDFVFEDNLTKDELIAKWAELLAVKLDTNETGYDEIIVLYNGEKVQWPDYPELESEAKEAADQIVSDRKKAKAEEERTKMRAEEKAREERERAQLARLQKKYDEPV